MNDLPTLLASGEILQVDGKEIRVKPLTLSQQADLQIWIDSQCSYLLTSAVQAAQGLPKQEREILYRQAMDAMLRGRITLGSIECNQFLKAAPGAREVVIRTILAGGSVPDRAAAEAVFEKLATEQIVKAFAASQIMWANEAEREDDGGPPPA